MLTATIHGSTPARAANHHREVRACHRSTAPGGTAVFDAPARLAASSTVIGCVVSVDWIGILVNEAGRSSYPSAKATLIAQGGSPQASEAALTC